MLNYAPQKVHVIHWVRVDGYSSAETAYKDGIQQLETLVARLLDNDL